MTVACLAGPEGTVPPSTAHVVADLRYHVTRLGPRAHLSPASSSLTTVPPPSSHPSSHPKAPSVEIYSNLWVKPPVSMGLIFPKFQMGAVIIGPPTSKGNYNSVAKPQ